MFIRRLVRAIIKHHKADGIVHNEKRAVPDISWVEPRVFQLKVFGDLRKPLWYHGFDRTRESSFLYLNGATEVQRMFLQWIVAFTR